MKNTLNILEYAMNMEKKGQEFYITYKDKVSNPQIKELFESIADVENDHYNTLKKQYDYFFKNNSLNNIDFELSKGEELYGNRSVEISSVNLEYDVSDLPIVRMAYLLENDFALFYERAAEKVEDLKAKELLQKLAKWEVGHRESFYREYKKIMENTWFEQGFSPF